MNIPSEQFETQPVLKTPESLQNLTKRKILTMQEWIDLQLSDDEQSVIIGTPRNPIIRPMTKNLIEAPDKSFKTTVVLRLMAGLSCGHTFFPELPVPRARKVLYLHGELSIAEIRDRTIAASKELPGLYSNLLQGTATGAHLVNPEGQLELSSILEDCRPDDLVLDPWQEFISGCDENSFRDMSAATDFCNKLIREFGVTLWIPIHLGKNHQKGARGHSRIQGWRDTRIQLTRDRDTVTIKVDPRWAAPLEPFRLRFKDGTMWSTGQFVFKGQHEEIRSFVESEGGKVTKEKLLEHLISAGKTKEAARKAVKRAEEAQAVVADGDYLLVPSVTSSTSIN
jgi:hypothetical protein